MTYFGLVKSRFVLWNLDADFADSTDFADWADSVDFADLANSSILLSLKFNAEFANSSGLTKQIWSAFSAWHSSNQQRES